MALELTAMGLLLFAAAAICGAMVWCYYVNEGGDQ